MTTGAWGPAELVGWGKRPERGRGLGGCRLACDLWGEGTPRVVLVHSVGLDRRSWDEIVPALRRRCRVAAVDLPGHGESEKPRDADYGLRSLGSRLIRFLDELGWEDAVFVGNSLGGGSSLSAALQAPGRIRGLALLNSVGLSPGLPVVGRLGAIPFMPPLAALAPTLAVKLGLEFACHGWGTVRKSRCETIRLYLRDPEGRAAFFRTLQQLYGPDMEAMAERYGEIRCPVLVIHGIKDPLISLTHARELEERIPGAELREIPLCGHFPQEERPRAVLRRLLPFLERLRDSPS